ncbi:DUF2752 domain-containing protein [Janibacter sp. G56]|uniref:DUF2752 domain-containing protein n=1 Tax=Janibacter sp. G56 TaxID=3418717 RepID=UPI003D016AE4
MESTERVLGGTALAVAAAGAAGLAAAFVLTPAGVDDGPVLCPVRRLTGLPCPGCGLTRSWVHLAHGDLSTALSLNLFGPALMAAVAAFVGYVLLRLVRGRTPAPAVAPFRSPWTLAPIVLWLAWGAIRAVALALGVGDDAVGAVLR